LLNKLETTARVLLKYNIIVGIKNIYRTRNFDAGCEAISALVVNYTAQQARRPGDTKQTTLRSKSLIPSNVQYGEYVIIIWLYSPNRALASRVGVS
jgi:hypothetical protein